MPSSGKRAPRREELQLELMCEWGSCQETFGRMQEFCEHVETHYKTVVEAETDLLGGSITWTCIKNATIQNGSKFEFDVYRRRAQLSVARLWLLLGGWGWGASQTLVLSLLPHKVKAVGTCYTQGSQ